MTTIGNEALPAQPELFPIDEYHVEPVAKIEDPQGYLLDSPHDEETTNIPKSYDEFDEWVIKMKSDLQTRNWGNPERKYWSVERGLLFHYQSWEEFLAGECVGYSSQKDGSVLVDFFALGENLEISEAIKRAKKQYAARTKRLTEIVAKQEALGN